MTMIDGYTLNSVFESSHHCSDTQHHFREYYNECYRKNGNLENLLPAFLIFTYIRLQYKNLMLIKDRLT